METVWRWARGGTREAPRRAAGTGRPVPAGSASDDLIDRFAIVGTGEFCAQRPQEIIDLRFRPVMIGTHTAGVDLEERNTDRIAAEVLPLVRRSPAS
jgi:DNA helicase TIP49 (TBP-interacting protein)